MKTLRYKNIMLLLLIGFTAVSCAQSQDDKAARKAAYDNIDVARFDKLREQDKYTVIDVRTPEECAEGKVDGALEMDFFADDFEEKLKQLDSKGHYLIYCRSGNRSGKTASKMKEMGFKHVSNLEGGYLKWSEIHEK